MLLKKILNKVLKRGKTQHELLSEWRSTGIQIGNDCRILDPNDIWVDKTRPELLTIGNHVFLHKGTVIMTHDWAGWCFLEKYDDFVPSCGPVTIGNNVWLGSNVTILKNVEIGDNVIIGAGSIVTKSIPSNSVAVGTPAKVVKSIDDFYNERKIKSLDETEEYCLAILKSGREPKVEDFNDNFPIFVNASNYKDYPINYSRLFTEVKFKKWLANHESRYKDFDSFIAEMKKRYSDLR